MSPAEYIESGMLELYASGAVSPAEKQEVEQMALLHTEVREALDMILADFENYARLHAVQPDPQLREHILNSILSPVSAAEKGKVISINPAPVSGWKNMAIAASVVLVLSVGINIWFVFQNKTNQETTDRLLAEKSYRLDSAETMLRQSQSSLADYQKTLDFLRAPSTLAITLNTTDTAHPMKAMIHWDMKSKMVAVDPMTLPATAPNQVYVLWSVVDGKAINEGAFTVSDTTGIMMLQEAIPNAEAFAISLETKRDVPQHEGPIYVLGKPVQP